MDTSIRFYNANSNLRPVVDAERKGHPAPPLSVEEDSGVERVDEEMEVVDERPQLDVPALQEQVQKIAVLGPESSLTQVVQPRTASTAVKRIAVGVSATAAQCMNAAATMAGVLRATWQTARLWNVC